MDECINSDEDEEHQRCIFYDFFTGMGIQHSMVPEQGTGYDPIATGQGILERLEPDVMFSLTRSSRPINHSELIS